MCRFHPNRVLGPLAFVSLVLACGDGPSLGSVDLTWGGFAEGGSGSDDDTSAWTTTTATTTPTGSPTAPKTAVPTGIPTDSAGTLSGTDTASGTVIETEEATTSESDTGWPSDTTGATDTSTDPTDESVSPSDTTGAPDTSTGPTDESASPSDTTGATDTSTDPTTDTGTSTGASGEVPPPIAVDDSYRGRQEKVVASVEGVLANDSGDSIVIDSWDATSTEGGTVFMLGDGRFTYEPASSFWCLDTFDYTIRDSEGRTSTATVTITVAPVLANVEQIELGNTCGFAINGETSGDQAARAVSGAGDVNGDGLEDLIVGAPYAGASGSEGRSYIVFGRGEPTPVSLADIADGSGGFAIEGGGSEWSGWTVKRAGDVNGDGLDDVLVGSPFDGTGGTYAGRAYVVFGKGSNTDAVSLLDVAAGGENAGGFVIEPEAAQTLVGQSVSAAGDVDGDGFDDVLIGARYAPEAPLPWEGRAYVVFGKSDHDPVELSTVAAGGELAGGFKIDGVSHLDLAGFSASAAGDVNRDGLGDVIIGAPGDSAAGEMSGRAYVVFGRAGTDPVSLADIADQIGAGFAIQGAAEGDLAGFDVGGGEDIDADNIPDLVVGAPGASPGGEASGRAFVVFGKSNPGFVDLNDVLAGTGGFVINGAAAQHNAGHSVAITGDIDGDGYEDILVGEPGSPAGGRAHVVRGRIRNTDAVSLADVAQGVGGFTFEAASPDDLLGFSVEAAGDVDNDGFQDIIIGAYAADPVPSDSGTAYVVFGGDFR